MSDFKPRTRTEQFLAAATGDYTGELPKPITREQEYLEKLVRYAQELLQMLKWQNSRQHHLSRLEWQFS